MERKHAALIRAWAEGATIQMYSDQKKTWVDKTRPTWNPNRKYRIKPDEDYVWEAKMVVERNEVVAKVYGRSNLRLTFDRKTKKLIAAEVLT
ncbi:MAG: hypothetical protein ACK5SP_02170 [bacterium]|jgi:hypothetical protein